MKHEIIRQEIRKVGSMREAAEKLNIKSTVSLYNKLNGECPWKVDEILALSRLCKWSKKQFLDIIEFKEA